MKNKSRVALTVQWLKKMWQVGITVSVLLSISCSMDKLTGGGSDIGNPTMTGVALTADFKPASHAKVVIGSIDKDSVLDSTYTNTDGTFSFRGVAIGLYAVIGNTDSLSGIARVMHDSTPDASVTLILEQPPTIQLMVDSSATDSSSKIGAAKIVGTRIAFARQTSGNFALNRAPAGIMDIRVRTVNDSLFTLKNYRSVSACEAAYIIVDPALPPERWISGGCGPRDPMGSPMVIWVSPPPASRGAIACVNRDNTYDMAIQFSHPMNTRLTTNAVTGWASDTSIKIINKSWIGSDVLYVSFSWSSVLNTFGRFRFPLGVTYYVNVDTTAESAFGVAIAKKYRTAYTPEPCPRLISVEGFRYLLSSAYELVDSLPPVVSLGDSVSPSIGLLAGNTLTLQFVGTVASQQLSNAIHCYESDTVPVSGIQITSYYNSLTIKFPTLMKSGNSYRVVVDTALRFAEGFNLPRQQTIVWKTLQFTIDNALLLGVEPKDFAKPISTIINQYNPRNDLLRYSPNKPVTTWYASAPVDTASLRQNLVLPAEFANLPLVVDGSKFGFYSTSWLPTGKKFTFKVLPGLRSTVGDSIGKTIEYSVMTDSLRLKDFNVFSLSRPDFIENMLPYQDSLYTLYLGGYSDGSANTLQYTPIRYSAWVNYNAPLKDSSAAKLTVTPATGFDVKSVGTGFGLFAHEMLIPDTTYVVKLESGVADSFSSINQQSFEYRFKTEKFGLKIGNLFGVYFGYQKEMAQLPAQILPSVQVIDQNVRPGQSFQPFFYKFGEGFGSGSFDSINFYANPAPPSTNLAPPGMFMLFPSTPIGQKISFLQPGFDNNENYLCFSGLPDSTTFVNHVHIRPNDGSIQLKVDANKLRFSTSLSCRANTQYTITLDKDFSERYGHTLGDSISVGFSTPSFFVDSIMVNNTHFTRDSLSLARSIPVQPTRDFMCSALFNYPLGIASVDNSFVCEPAISGLLSVSSSRIDFSRAKLLIPDTLYQITLNTGITDRFDAPLDTSYTIAFRTEPFAIDSLEIGKLESGSLFLLKSNALLDTASFQSAIHISPSRYASGKVTPSTDSTGFTFVADSSARFGDSIVVVVDTSLKDRFNHSAKSADTLAFIVTTKSR